MRRGGRRCGVVESRPPWRWTGEGIHYSRSRHEKCRQQFLEEELFILGMESIPELHAKTKKPKQGQRTRERRGNKEKRAKTKHPSILYRISINAANRRRCNQSSDRPIVQIGPVSAVRFLFGGKRRMKCGRGESAFERWGRLTRGNNGSWEEQIWIPENRNANDCSQNVSFCFPDEKGPWICHQKPLLEKENRWIDKKATRWWIIEISTLEVGDGKRKKKRGKGRGRGWAASGNFVAGSCVAIGRRPWLYARCCLHPP